MRLTRARAEYSELHAILRGMVIGQRYRAESAKPLRIAARRLAAGRGTPGFGNGRAVRSFLEAAVRRQQERLAAARQERGGTALLGGDAVNVLTSSDLLGPCAAPEQLAAVAELEAMVGLCAVKKQVRMLCALMADNLRREADEEPPLRISLNRLFLGNPGTGKTSVGVLYGRILKEMGILSKGDVLVRTPADFVGTVVGESEKRTADILAAARGKVCTRWRSLCACVRKQPSDALLPAPSRAGAYSRRGVHAGGQQPVHKERGGHDCEQGAGCPRGRHRRAAAGLSGGDGRSSPHIQPGPGAPLPTGRRLSL
jgi:hypothetical protein